MKLAKKWRIYTASSIIGVVGGAALASAPPIIPEPIQPAIYTNCPSPLAGCKEYKAYQRTIDPFCCSESVTSCSEYKVDIWTCKTNEERYRDFQLARTLLGFNCDATGPGCY